MKAAAFTIALLMSGASFAQIADTAIAYDGDGVATTAFETDVTNDAMDDTADLAIAGIHVAQPGNSAPERDARGIAVISDPAVVPAGWNGTAAVTAVGGPELDPAGAEMYPACTATVTDNCLQTYEKGRQG